MEEQKVRLQSAGLTRQEIALEIWKRLYDRIQPENLETAITQYNQIFEQLHKYVSG